MTTYTNGQLQIKATILKETKLTITAEVTFPTGLTKALKFKKDANTKGIAKEVTTGNIVGGRLYFK